MEENTNITTETIEEVDNAPQSEITNQKDFDKALKSRLEQEREKQAKKYADYSSPEEVDNKINALKEEYENKLAQLGNSLNGANEQATADKDIIAELEARVQKSESALAKSRIAQQYGIPYELADKLSGDTEEALRKDAETMVKFLSPRVAPLRNPESSQDQDGVLAAFRALNPNLKI